MAIEQKIREQEWINQILRFRIDVVLATNSLIYTLWGINLVHRQSKGYPVNSFPIPDYPSLKVLPQVTMNTPFSERVAPNGPIEQLAFKAWVTEVYDHLWEGKYRNRLRKVFQDPKSGKARMETDPLGDLRLIRNDLIHNKSIAKDCAKGKILRWFNRDEQIQMKFGHILDFLNQMGWIDNNHSLVDGDRMVLWLPPVEEVTPSEKAPCLVSVRPLIYELDEFQYRYCASVVFADGYFAKAPFTLHESEQMTDERWRNIQINSHGDVFIPPSTTICAQQLYSSCFGPTFAGPGLYSPAFKLR
ncbi:MAG: hypothetical protein F4X09_09460 [Gammaproteobacteria bacterium]|nr:hypothetical protein [Gammaproteobacteria bacterium]